ncbi:MAG: hypothetical protein U5L72_12930 [Bacteroidales bacterium]|nr:hypothetical protein [Bacteroidales bacterium]
MYNQGIEMRVAVDVVKSPSFVWNIDVNASTVKNEITKLPQEEIISGTKKLMVGKSIYDFWLRTGTVLTRLTVRHSTMPTSRTLSRRLPTSGS